MLGVPFDQLVDFLGYFVGGPLLLYANGGGEPEVVLLDPHFLQCLARVNDLETLVPSNNIKSYTAQRNETEI